MLECGRMNGGKTPHLCTMQFLADKKTWLQILFWCSLWLLVPLFLAGGLDSARFRPAQSATTFLGVALVVWMNLEVLLPRLYFKQGRKLLYVLAGLALLSLVVAMAESLTEPLADWLSSRWELPMGRGGFGRSGTRYITLSMPFFTSFIGSALVAVAGFADRKVQEAALLRSEKLEAELKFLKAQTNPHFLFNALNNIYALTVLKSDRAPDNLLKLSGMLRYMLYETKEATVPLEKEVAYLRHFIDLHLLKDSQGLNVEVHFDNTRPGLHIAPMLLLPFVENAFKHSKIEDLKNGWIRIHLRTPVDGIELEVQNSRPVNSMPKDKIGGIGLHNVRRQLELLYPGRHTLEVREEDQSFAVFLKIKV